MSKRNKNPYKRGAYHALFAVMQASGIVTRSQLVSAAQKEGMSESAANATVTVLLSPRETSGRGDCRGNISAQGHIYFVEKLKKNGGEQRYRLRFRKTPLEPRTRASANSVEQKKTSTKRASSKKGKGKRATAKAK